MNFDYVSLRRLERFFTDLKAWLASKYETGAEVNTIESISANGTKLSPDADRNVNITASQVGAEPAFSVLPIEKGGTGGTTQKAAAYNIFANILTINEKISDTSEWVQGIGNPSATLGPFCRNKITRVWEYIQSKISSDLGLSATEYGGKAATAGSADTASAAESGSTLESAINEKVTKFEFTQSEPYRSFVVLADITQWYDPTGTATLSKTYQLVGQLIYRRPEWGYDYLNVVYIKFHLNYRWNLNDPQCCEIKSTMPSSSFRPMIIRDGRDENNVKYYFGLKIGTLWKNTFQFIGMANEIKFSNLTWIPGENASHTGQGTDFPLGISILKDCELLEWNLMANGGTGATTEIGAEYNILNHVEDIDAVLNGDRKIALCNVTKSASNGVFRWIKLNNVWTWIKGLLASESDVNISGNAATATHLSAYGTCDTMTEGSYDSTKPYAIIGELTYDCTEKDGESSLLQFEFGNTDFVKLKLNYNTRGGASYARDALLIEGTNDLAWVSRNIKVLDTFESIDDRRYITIRIYVKFTSDGQVWRVRQLDCQTGINGYTNWRPWTFYQRHGTDQTLPAIVDGSAIPRFRTPIVSTAQGNKTTGVYIDADGNLKGLPTARCYFSPSSGAGYRRLVKIVPGMSSGTGDRIIRFSAIQTLTGELPKVYEGVIEFHAESTLTWSYARETKFNSVDGNIVLWYSNSTNEAYLVAKSEVTYSGFNLKIETCIDLLGVDQTDNLVEFYNNNSRETSIPSGFSELTGA